MQNHNVSDRKNKSSLFKLSLYALEGLDYR